MPKPKREEAGSLFEYEIRKLQRLETQGGAAYGSLRNLVKTSNSPVSKMKHLRSKISYAKITPATRINEKTKASARFKNEKTSS